MTQDKRVSGQTVETPIKPSDLTWKLVQPQNNSFDQAIALSIAHSAFKEVSPNQYQSTPAWADGVEESITRKFKAEYGAWAVGWRFANQHVTSYDNYAGNSAWGPVHAWCCPEHSILDSNSDDDWIQAASRAASALAEWRSYIEKLDQLFRQAAPRLEDEDLAALDIHSAIGRIVTCVVEATKGAEFWYFHGTQVISWYFESMGLPAETAKQVAREATSGIFRSWLGPNELQLEVLSSDFVTRIMPLLAEKKTNT